MTKLIGILIIAVVIWGGYELFEVWNRYDTEKDVKQKQAEEASQLPRRRHCLRMPSGLESSYETAQKNGAVGIRNWLQAYGNKLEDPRKAWVELDYVVAVSREDPLEAKKVFAEVKARTPESSRVYPRIKELAKTCRVTGKGVWCVKTGFPRNTQHGFRLVLS